MKRPLIPYSEYRQLLEYYLAPQRGGAHGRAAPGQHRAYRWHTRYKSSVAIPSMRWQREASQAPMSQARVKAMKGTTLPYE